MLFPVCYLQLQGTLYVPALQTNQDQNQADVVQPSWWVYVLTSVRSRRTYVGCTLDVNRRLSQHNGNLPGGAKSTRAGRPWMVERVYGPYPDRSTAQRAEATVKRLKGTARLHWSGVIDP